MMDVFPRHWKDETGGALRAVIRRYLLADPLSESDCLVIRAYLRQWILAPVWVGNEDLAELRAAVEELTERAAIARWIAAAEAQGIDPL